MPHLSKGSTDPKWNCTQYQKPVSGLGFCAISHGVNCFVACVSFKNHQMEVSNWRISTRRRWFFELTLATKWVTPHERACKTGPENGFFDCVPFS